MEKQKELQTELRLKFYHDISISSKANIKIQKGIIDGEFVVQKIITCKTSDEELYYRHVFEKRKKTELNIKSTSAFHSKNVCQTVVDTIEGVQKHFVLIFQPYISLTKITSLVSTSPKLLQQTRLPLNEKASRMRSIILNSASALLHCSNYQLYTYQTFFFNEYDKKIMLNTNSFVGMKLMTNNQILHHRDFEEIVQVLDSKALDRPPEERFTLQLKFRALGILILSLVLEKRLKLFYKKILWDKAEKTPSLEVYQEFLKQTPQTFGRLIQMPEIKRRITVLEELTQIQIIKFVKKVLVSEESMTWLDVFACLVPQKMEDNQFQGYNLPISTLQLANELMNLADLESRQFQLFKELGINQSKIYLFILLYDVDAPLSELMSLSSLNSYIFSTKKFNLQNQNLFKKLLKIVDLVMAQKKIDLYYQYSIIVDRYQSLQTIDQFELIKKYIHQKDNQTSKIDYPSLFSYIKLLTKTFGVFVRQPEKDKKGMKAYSHQAITIKTYQRLFR